MYVEISRNVNTKMWMLYRVVKNTNGSITYDPFAQASTWNKVLAIVADAGGSIVEMLIDRTGQKIHKAIMP